jgi:ribosomal protein S4
VNHGLITVNGKRITIPSLRVRPGDVVALDPKTADLIAVRHNLDTLGRIVPAWLERNGEATSTTVLGVPMRETSRSRGASRRAVAATRGFASRATPRCQSRRRRGGAISPSMRSRGIR